MCAPRLDSFQQSIAGTQNENYVLSISFACSSAASESRSFLFKTFGSPYNIIHDVWYVVVKERYSRIWKR